MRPDAIHPPGGSKAFCCRGGAVILCPRVGRAAAGAGVWAVLLDRRSWRCRPLAWRPRWACRCKNAVQDGILDIPRRDGGVLQDDVPERSLFPSTSQIAVVLEEDGQKREGGHEETDTATASGTEAPAAAAASEEASTPPEDTEVTVEEPTGTGSEAELDTDAKEGERVSALAESLLEGRMGDEEFVELHEATLGSIVEHLGNHSSRMKMAEEVVKQAIRLNRVSDLVLSKFFEACGVQGRLDVMQSCFVHWLKEDNVPCNELSVTALIAASLKNQQLECGREVVRELIDHNMPVGTTNVNSLIQELSRAEKVEESLELFDWLQCSDQQHADRRTYQTVLWGMRKSNKLGSLRMVYEAFLEEGWDLDAPLYFAFMTAAATAHDSSFADELLELFKKGSGDMDCKVLNMYLQVLSQSKRSPPHLEEILQMYSSFGVDPDAYTFTSLLTAAYRNHQQMSVIDMLIDEIRKRGMPMTSVTSCAAILGYKNCTMDPPAKRFERAQEVFDLTEDRNHACYHLLMSLYTENMDLASAIRLLNDMEAEGLTPNSRTYKTLEQACTEACLLGYAEKYEKLWKQELERGKDESNVKLGKE